MKATDIKRVFLDAASHFQVWILVRRTNPSSFEYIGKPGFVPKPINCKAKTADKDLGRYKLAGLVIDPTDREDAFKPERFRDALKCWEDTRELIGEGLFTVDRDDRSRHCGCLMLQGDYIHGDHDLYDIIDITQAHRNLAGVEVLLGKPHMRGSKVLRVQEFVNSRIGSPILQHGGDAQFLSEHRSEPIDAFGPSGEDVTILNQFSVQAWYRERFGGRQLLGRGTH
jgi:hypothetical protein